MHRARRLQEHEREAPNHRDGGRRSQPARGSPRRLEATRGNRQQATSAALRCDFRVRRTEPHHRWAGDPELKGSANGFVYIDNSSRHPEAGHARGHQPCASNRLASRHSADGASADAVTEQKLTAVIGSTRIPHGRPQDPLALRAFEPAAGAVIDLRFFTSARGLPARFPSTSARRDRGVRASVRRAPSRRRCRPMTICVDPRRRP